MHKTQTFDEFFNGIFEGFETFAESVTEKFPPRNVIKVSEEKYQITVAVAGFEKEDLSVEAEDDVLIISGNPSKKFNEDRVKFIHRGLSNRSFKMSYKIEGMIVEDVRHRNGLLTIDLSVVEPEKNVKKFDIK